MSAVVTDTNPDTFIFGQPTVEREKNRKRDREELQKKKWQSGLNNCTRRTIKLSRRGKGDSTYTHALPTSDKIRQDPRDPTTSSKKKTPQTYRIEFPFLALKPRGQPYLLTNIGRHMKEVAGGCSRNIFVTQGMKKAWGGEGMNRFSA